MLPNHNLPYQKTLTALVILVALMAIIATSAGIFSDEGGGPYPYTSIRGNVVTIYGKGLYKDMSAEVAPQGIAQDYITLFLAVPLLLFSLLLARKGSLRGRYLLAGTLGYFLVTYLFYTAMGMYNSLFIGYVILLGLSFYAFLITLLSFEVHQLPTAFSPSTPLKATGGFLILNSVAIGLLWLSVVLPPLLNGTIVPVQVEHYTTLIVQGFDLGLLLPAGFITAVLFIRKKQLGYLLCPVYFVFLSILMTALTAKVVAMALLGYSVIPVIFIIPTFNVITIICTITILKHLNTSVSIYSGSASWADQTVKL
ncbi:hypothetical protein F5984_16790 [Rudanella paleaurantiibacter]|uniref:Uncharacterized protein n=1 Tax=Rudanella paleaurantiibacter TaxID=2614655 RepID=A0A7J5TXI0_9BACT|nr:hypothetical protein [Rudanella paleaurantiibacter]KAB7729287.1 hypothetical protein F5984_16790 [Rudanella paleaurantiibacter]